MEMTVSQKVSRLLLAVSLAACVSSAPVIVGYVGADAVSLIAGEQDAMAVVFSNNGPRRGLSAIVRRRARAM